jgi:hypothetical protein
MRNYGSFAHSIIRSRDTPNWKKLMRTFSIGQIKIIRIGNTKLALLLSVE